MKRSSEVSEVGVSYARQWSQDCGCAMPLTRLRLVEHLPLARDAALVVENAAYVRCGGVRWPYLAEMKRLLYNLETNGQLRAIGETDGARLTHMSDTDMKRGTPLEQVEKDEAARIANLDAALQARYEDIQSCVSTSTMRCRRCHKTNLAFEQKQTRSAGVCVVPTPLSHAPCQHSQHTPPSTDESMTVFISCKDCGTNWKL